MPRRFNKSNELYERAITTIPLASQTYSKSAMNFVAGAAPLFLDRGEGARVWDIDGNSYVDYVLALLPIVLGYRDPDVDDAVRRQLDRGIILSLATELEVELAETLVRLIPCAEMVRFAKNGSDVTTAAIRLARAHTGRDRVALCGYHGWHDWYIGTTSRDLGVPASVQALSSPFQFNDVDSLEHQLRKDPNGFAAIILEPAGSEEPRDGFLAAIRELADRYGAMLIFDEIVTGFRIDLRGAQAKYGVTPDLACFGKSMGNGMPIAALVGQTEIMRRVEDVFFSGTFGGEALSLAAALTTIEKLEATDGVRRNQETGDRLKKIIGGALSHYGLRGRFDVVGPAWRPVLSVAGDGLAKTTAQSLLRQELAENGVLCAAGINICAAHDDEEILGATAAGWDKACMAIAEAYNDPNPARHLRGKPIQPIFQVRNNGG